MYLPIKFEWILNTYGVLTLEKTILKQTLMPGPCSVFQSVNNFGNRFYQKEKRPGCALLFSIESVIKVVNRLKRTTWTRHKCQFKSILLHDKIVSNKILIQSQTIRFESWHEILLVFRCVYL